MCCVFVCSAEDWNLGKPLATCHLVVERRDDVCLIRCMTDKPKEGGPPGSTEEKLFCRCDVDLQDPSHKLEQYCEAVVDSSRYFVLRIVDPRTGRAAHIGVGFRQREDASNFRLALQDYERSLQRERAAQQKQAENEKQQQQQQQQQGTGGEESETPELSMSKLTLKEGEKIHINLKGHETTTTTTGPAKGKPKSSGGGVPLLLKKPPPPAAAGAGGFQISLDGMERPPVGGDANVARSSNQSVDSDGAIADDEEWNEFQ